MSPRAHEGWAIMLNYVGGSYIYVRTKFAGRLRILASSWATANNKKVEIEDEVEVEGDSDERKEGE
jgi:hypothetical protein